MTESERDMGRRWFEEVWNRRRRAAIGEMIAPDAVVHDGRVETVGPDAFYLFFDRISSAFSDIHVDVEDTIAENDRLCVRWSSTAKHTGDGLGIPPTGVKIKITGISILRVRGEVFVEAWQNWDMQGLMDQLKGVGPSATYIVAVPAAKPEAVAVTA